MAKANFHGLIPFVKVAPRRQPHPGHGSARRFAFCLESCFSGLEERSGVQLLTRTSTEASNRV